jgi:hypothetical protein
VCGSLILKYLVVAAVEFVVGKVGVALGDLDVLVASEFLSEFEVAAGGA